jgi:hypothetical protein
MTPNPKNMSADGLANAIATHLPALPPETRMWVWAYVTELHRRAEIADKPGFLRGHPQREAAE